MKKTTIILLIVLIQSLYSYNEEIDRIIYASFIDTHLQKISSYQQKSNNGTLKIIFKKGDVITYEEDRFGRVEFSKQNIKGSLQTTKKMIRNGTIHSDFFDETFTIYGQHLNIVSCINKKKEAVLSVVLNYTDSSRIYPQYIRYKAKIYIIHDDSYKAIAEKDNVLSLENYWDNIIVDSPDSDKKPYPYFNEPRILERLYETGTCDKKATNEANIEVLLGNKWIPQEQSWNIKEKIATTILTLNQLLENAKSNQKLTFEQINEVLKNEELNIKTLQKYNDLAYYLQLSNKNKEAIFILEKIIEKFPNRTVAYLNLADAYNGLNNKDNAKQNYKKYIELMKLDNKKSKIPIRVFEHLNVFKSKNSTN
jgi:hypothetical protein